jgi:hypothetical protein
MKKTLFVAAIACLLGSYSFTSTANEYSKSAIVMQVEKKTKVNKEELPQSIQKLLKDEDYKEWDLDQAYHITGKGDYYKVELKKGDQKQTLNLDQYANKVSVMES